MRLSVTQYDATASALQAEASIGTDPSEKKRLTETARLAKRLAELTRERRQNSKYRAARNR